MDRASIGSAVPRILIVDDEPLVAKMVAEWVEELGHEVAGPFRDASSALALVAATPPDAAIVDVSLGAGSGYTVAESLAQRKIPFVFATGHAEGSLIPRFSGTPVLVKPYDFGDVDAAIGKMIGRGPS
jgi:CheY-like chemotaxis protein